MQKWRHPHGRNDGVQSAALPAMAEEITQAAGKTPVVDFENRETSQLDSSAAETVLSESTPPETEISSQEVSDAQNWRSAILWR